MSVSYGTGYKGKATKLHSKIVRSLGYCQRCGDTDYAKLQAAHIIPRQYSATRTDIDNAYCLCASCHRYFTDFPRRFSHFITDTIGSERYEELEAKARQVTKMDWQEEYERLQKIAKSKGL